MAKKKKENEILKYVKEHKILISVVSLIVIVLLITGTTLAIFLVRKEGNEKTYTLGNVNVEYFDGDTFKVTNSIPLADYEIEEYAAKKEFSFQNTGDITMYAEVLLTEIDISEDLKNNDFRWILYEKDNDEYNEISNGNFAEINNNKTISLKKGIHVIVEDEPKYYKIVVYIRDNGGNQNEMMTSYMNCKVTITATDKPTEYVDGSGANPPKLADGMIPVTYDEDADVWVKANVMKKWYDYDEQWWANAVTVYPEASTCNDDNSCVDEAEKHNREYYLNAKAGTPISMDDINSMWVWIPRYKYRIPNGVGIGTKENPIENPPMIDIKFETGLQATGVDEATYRNSIKDDGTIDEDIYYTHPAFRDGSKIYNDEPYDVGGWDRELTGIWIAKFETSTDSSTCKNDGDENCKDADPIIKPDVRIMPRLNLVELIFKNSLKFSGGTLNDETGEVIYNGNDKYGLNNGVNTHMAKNTEWGAVAYLSHSQYGKTGNKNYSGEEKEVYQNNSPDTGKSEGVAPAKSTNSHVFGTYSYNDHLCLSNELTKCTGKKEKGKGTGASTTGTIYGVYDMSGGGQEFVLTKRKNQTFFNISETKYFDYKDTIDHAILGDSTWETDFWNTGTANYSEWKTSNLCRSMYIYGSRYFGVFMTKGCSDYRFRGILIP